MTVAGIQPASIGSIALICWRGHHHPLALCPGSRLRVTTGTLQTRYTFGEFQHADMTAAGIARELGYSHLFDILAPVMRHYIPANDLINLQSQFHDFLRLDMGGSLDRHHLWLPELVVLTELERPEMWFPVEAGGQSSRVSHLLPLFHVLRSVTVLRGGCFDWTVANSWSSALGRLDQPRVSFSVCP